MKPGTDHRRKVREVCTVSESKLEPSTDHRRKVREVCTASKSKIKVSTDHRRKASEVCTGTGASWSHVQTEKKKYVRSVPEARAR